MSRRVPAKRSVDALAATVARALAQACLNRIYEDLELRAALRRAAAQ